MNCSVFQQKLFGETSTELPHVVEAVLSKMHSTQTVPKWGNGVQEQS